MTVGVLRETFAGERRVALVPAHVGPLVKAGAAVVLETGAGWEAGFRDQDYAGKGAEIAADAAAVLSRATVLLTVRFAAAAESDAALIGRLQEGAALIGFLEPWKPHDSFARLRDRGVSSFAMELMPRITRAQSMDALSSMANLAGYKAAVMAAASLPKMLPMMMTAAGTIVPARAFIVGVGVAGLQAIATARRLGAVVSAYDVRPAVREQVQSLGARFVEIELDAEDAETSDGYARQMDEDFYRRQRELMTGVLAESDIVITTAAVPGKTAPVLVTRQMVEAMHAGSVIVDLAAERGGNCALTRAGETVQHNGVTILGPLNLASTLARDASQLYSKNITAFLQTIVKDGELAVDGDDEIVAATVVTHARAVPNEETRSRLQL
ncbi:MAG: Re/Si-specific NAD(P)(+) transhydrogenase subunit alpha [Spirochaetaceae bacterium]|nr:MAG: Re/Si-specific NAD(P)(+) transhydrogenase subunit alpha [Spirochaetaceae bacterium]